MIDEASHKMAAAKLVPGDSRESAVNEGHSRAHVQSVDRAIDLFERLWGTGEPLTITELSAETGLPLATVHRLLSTLERRGWVRRDATSHRYDVGLRFLECATRRAPHLARLLQPHLEVIAEQTGETANAAVLDGVWGVYVAQAEGHHAVRMFTRIGHRVHLHRTGVGKVLLAYGPADLVGRMIDAVGMPAATPQSLAKRGLLDRELAEIRARGYAVDREEEEVGVSCVAVPLGSGEEHYGLALSVSGPSGRILPLERTLHNVLSSVARSVVKSIASGEHGSPPPRT